MFTNGSGIKSDVSTILLNPINVIALVSVWEIIFQLSGFIFKKLYQSKPGFFIADNSDDSARKDTEKRKKRLLQNGPSYIVSSIHAIVVSIMGCVGFVQLFHTLPKFQMQQIHVSSILLHPEISALDYKSISSIHSTIEFLNLLFFSYLFNDILHVIAAFPSLGGFDTIAHHSLFMIASLINGCYVIMLFPFTWLIMGEISTIFLNIRWILIQTGRGSTSYLKLSNVMFAVTFFLTRVVLYGWGLIHLGMNIDVVMDVPAPRFLVIVVLTLVVGGFALDLFWMNSIYKLAVGSPSKKSSKSAEKSHDKKE